MKRILYCLIIIMSIAACSGPGPAPNDHYYRLPPVSADADQIPFMDGVVFVEQLIADGIYRERSIIYSEDPEGIELNRYHYHHWVDTPSRLIRDHFINYLRTSHFASQIVSVPEIPAQLSIYGRINQFERRITNSGVSVAVGLEFRVNTESSEIPVLLKEYSRIEKISDDSMSVSVNAFARLLGSIYAELIEDIRAATKGES